MLSIKRITARPKNNFRTRVFGKWLFMTRYWMSYSIYIPLNAKDLTIDLAMLAYGNRQSAIKFARANNSDLLQALKHLMGTRLTPLRYAIRWTH